MTAHLSDTPDAVTVALVQTDASEQIEANVSDALRQIATAAEQGARIVCLQELFATRYPCQSEDHSRFEWAEPIPGPTCGRLQQAAKEHQVVLIASMCERRAAGIYHNTAIVIDADGRLVGRYRKMHIPDDPLYYEKFYFTPGDLGFRCFKTRYGQIGVGICWDQWFPEAARLLALAGAEFLFFPTAIGWLAEEKSTVGESQLAAWETMMRSHAIANGLFVAAANRVGTEDRLEFWGSSFVADPYGTVLARAARDQGQILLASCRRSLVDVARTHWPFLRDRRIDAYDGLAKRWGC